MAACGLQEMMENPILQGLHLTSVCRGQIDGIGAGKNSFLYKQAYRSICIYIYTYMSIYRVWTLNPKQGLGFRKVWDG